MAPKIFVDTNVIVDFLEQRTFELDHTNKIFEMVENNDIKGFVSESVITTALYVTALPEHIVRLLNIITVICIDTNTIKNALKSSFTDKEDGILYYGALDKKMDYFITRNKKDFNKYSLKQLPVLSSKELIRTIEK